MIERIKVDDIEVALIIKSDFFQKGINFFTNENEDFQLGYMSRPAGYKIKPHKHILKTRTINTTSEVLFLKKGNVRVNFYDSNDVFKNSVELKTGDLILLKNGAHGFDILSDSVMYEVKQGPFHGAEDKEHIE